MKHDEVEAILIEVSARLNTLLVVHAYDKDGWGGEFVRAEHVEDLKEWVDAELRKIVE